MFSRNAQFGAFLGRVQYVYQIGKISTFPKYREHHYAGYLFQEIEKIAKAENVQDIFISTNHTGLYEKYGCEFYQMMNDMDGEPSRIYKKHISSK